MYTYKVGFFIRLLRLSQGLFFIALGVCGIFTELHASVFEMTTHYLALDVIFGIVELFCGIMLILGFFMFKDSQAVFWGGFIAFIAWTVRIVLSKFIWGLSFMYNGNINIPNFIIWLLILLAMIIIDLSLLIVIRKYE
jgi:hypothetical protein